MKDFSGLLFAVSLLFLAGCAGIPMSRDVTATRSVDMVVHSDTCTAEAYVSVGGMSESGEPYERYGKVFYFPRRGELAYNPNFGWITGAISFVSFGTIGPGSEGSRYAKIHRVKQGWRVFLVQGNSLVPTEIVSKDKETAAKRGAVFLQTGIDPGDCVQFK